jgi:hypothetical protein
MRTLNAQDLAAADDLFKAGKFVEAEKRYSGVLQAEPDILPALTRLGGLALLANRLDDAQQWLTRALEIKQHQSWSQRTLARATQGLRKKSLQTPEALLGQVCYLRDDYRQAAPLLRAAGWKTQARKLERFGATRPYQLEGRAEAVSVKFIKTDPLPVIRVRVNGSEPVNFFIDTGGAEVIIDTKFAAEIGAAQFGGERGVFGGGKTAGFQHGRIDALTLSDLTVKNIPITIMPVRHFSDPVFDGLRVDGIIGTFFLYHFLATLDYPAGELILRPKTVQNRQVLEHTPHDQRRTVVPFWMADHYMVAWGTVNGSEPLLLFVDTGLAGNGFTCPESTLKKADIKLEDNLAAEGLGGGGKMSIIPLKVDELTLGDARESYIHGAYGAFPPQIEHAFGFHIGGLISHEFFRSYALTLDFSGMRYLLERKG